MPPRNREYPHVLRIDIREVPADEQGIRHGGISPIDPLTAPANSKASQWYGIIIHHHFYVKYILQHIFLL
jgi:hypothetical protein